LRTLDEDPDEYTRNQVYQEGLEATGIVRQNQGTVKTRQMPRFRGKVVGPRVDLRRVALSRLLESLFAYKNPCRDPKRKQIEN